MGKHSKTAAAGAAAINTAAGAGAPPNAPADQATGNIAGDNAGNANGTSSDAPGESSGSADSEGASSGDQGGDGDGATGDQANGADPTSGSLSESPRKDDQEPDDEDEGSFDPNTLMTPAVRDRLRKLAADELQKAEYELRSGPGGTGWTHNESKREAIEEWATFLQFAAAQIPAE